MLKQDHVNFVEAVFNDGREERPLIADVHVLGERHLANDGQPPALGKNSLEQNIAARFSRITVITQQQGHDDLGAATSVNVKKVVTDPTFPFRKPLVKTMSDDSVSPALYGRLLKEKMLNDGFRLSYQVPGHSQNGKNWKVNEICRVEDEVLGLSGSYLIYGRTFERSRGGTTTRLQLSLPGKVSE